MTKLTIEQIAELAGVSRSTVSRVLNDEAYTSKEAREKVEAAIAATNFRPNRAARTLRSKRSGIIGLVLRSSVKTVFDDPYFSKLTQGVTDACNRNNQMLALIVDDDDEKLMARIRQEGIFDGIVVQFSHDDYLLRQLIKCRIPTVISGRPDGIDRATYVDADNRGGAYQAVKHLIDLGHKKIACITGPATSTTTTDRLSGYKLAHRDAGLTPAPQFIAEGDFTQKSGYLAARTLLSKNPDAIFSHSDTMAIGALGALQEAGLIVPDDIALVGFDNLYPPNSTFPTLTTVHQPVRKMGDKMIELLLGLIKNPHQPPHTHIFDTELVIRESCGFTANAS